MKIAISGKGGVGKTTLTAMPAGTLALKGRNVIARGILAGADDDEIAPREGLAGNLKVVESIPSELEG